jgi:selenocysteine lyase/cysteine desulfurase
MTRSQLFIGSSREGIELARDLELQFKDNSEVEVTVWEDGIFRIGEASLESLMNALGQFEFAALLLTSDDLTTSRDLTLPSPRDNVLFELGLFIGRLGRHNTFIVKPHTEPVKLPSDLAGIALLEYGRRSDGRPVLGPVATRIRRVIQEVKRNSNMIIAPAGNTAMIRDTAISSRYMRWAAHGLCDPAVVMVVANHLAHPDPEIATILELPTVLAASFGLRNSFTFRANASQVFRDALESVLLHAINHKSRRGEEAAGAIQMLAEPERRAHVDRILYSDLDHPALKHLIQSIWPRGLTQEIRLADLLTGVLEPAPGDVVGRYESAVSATKCSAVLIPHVTWFNGAVLDVCSIARRLRALDSLLTIIVDGAQALGHIPVHIEQCELENSDIDFYVGCGHKWLAGPESVGFGRVSSRFATHCRECSQFLSANDHLSDLATTRLEFNGEQIGTNQRGLGKGLLQALRMSCFSPAHYSHLLAIGDRIREAISRNDSLQLFGPPRAVRSAIVAFAAASDNQTRDLNRKLEDHGFLCSVCRFTDGMPREGRDIFLRMSPGARFGEADCDTLSRVLNEDRM